MLVEKDGGIQDQVWKVPLLLVYVALQIIFCKAREYFKMDETIRLILQDALNGEKREERLMNAYSRLKRGQQPSDQSHPFTADVYVICAEAAYQVI